MNKKVLVIDDEENIVDILKFHLEKNGYETISANNGVDGAQLALTENPDLILLDVMLPGMDGFDVCKKIREQKNTPIIMLTARDDEVDKILGLELGADDYITKPFSARELLARIKANLRRITENQPAEKERQDGIMRFGKLTIDVNHYEVRRDGKVIDLSVREFELLRYMASQPGEIFTRENLLENVWGYEFYGDVRTVDVSIRRLREKIEQDQNNREYILTKRGVGYYFNKI